MGYSPQDKLDEMYSFLKDVCHRITVTTNGCHPNFPQAYKMWWLSYEQYSISPSSGCSEVFVTQQLLWNKVLFWQTGLFYTSWESFTAYGLNVIDIIMHKSTSLM